MCEHRRHKKLEASMLMTETIPTSLHANHSAGRGAAPEGAAPFCFNLSRRKAIVYVDGFNLYYGALKATPLRWLNPVALSSHLFPPFEIIACRYFTAKVAEAKDLDGQAKRQANYWRALMTVSEIQIIEGHFRMRKTWAKSANPPPDMVEIVRAEEKGSDVNLASHLLFDAFGASFDVALVVSGDSDLVTPIRMVTRNIGKPVGVINPQRLSGPSRRRCRGSTALKAVASYYRGGVTWAQLEKAQFPLKLRDDSGEFGPPPEWDA
jgi:uncharacterized LabA/DUF88 family protein